MPLPRVDPKLVAKSTRSRRKERCEARSRESQGERQPLGEPRSRSSERDSHRSDDRGVRFAPRLRARSTAHALASQWHGAECAATWSKRLFVANEMISETVNGLTSRGQQ